MKITTNIPIRQRAIWVCFDAPYKIGIGPMRMKPFVSFFVSYISDFLDERKNPIRIIITPITRMVIPRT